MRPTRILFVNHVSQMSGGEHGLINTINRLDRKEFEIAVALPAAGQLSEVLQGAGAQVEFIEICRLTKTWNPLRLLKYYISWLRGVRQITKLIRKLSIDLVHANSNTAQIYTGPAAARAGIPCIWHCRDLVNLGPLSRWMAAHTSRIAAVSEAVRQHLINSGVDPAAICTVHNVVDTTAFSPQAARNKESRNDSDGPLVAMAGQMVPWKNHDMFISCAALILKDVPTATFQIIGSDLFCEHNAYEGSLRARAEHELSGKIRFSGYCSNMPEKLAHIDVLLHPASREPFGRTLIEAMAMKKPVVAIDACGPAEIICSGKNGMLVHEGDVEAMAARAVELLTDEPLARRLGEAARSTVEKHYAALNPPEVLLSIYRDALSETAQ